MYKATVTTNRIRVDNPDNEIMTSGSVNVNFIEFTFSEDWRGLFKTVLFQTKKALLPIALEGDELTYTMPIPWEVLVYAGEQINIGAYGTKADDEGTPEDEEIIMPTVWGSIPDKVKQGVVVSDPTPSSPTYNAYLYLLQLLEDIIEGGGGGGGTLDHSKLTNRELAEQHPIDAVTGLRDTLTSLSGQITEISTKVITDHGELTGRDSEDQHPMTAITGLVAKFTQMDRTIDQVVSFIQSIASMLAGRSILFATIDKAGLPKTNDVKTYSRNEFVGIMPVVSETVRVGFLILDDTLYLANYTVTDVQGIDTTVTFVSDPILIGPASGGSEEPVEQRFTWLGYNDTGWNYVYDSQIGTWYDDTIFVHNFAHIIGNPKPGDPGIVFNLYKTGQYPPSLNLCTYKEAVLGTDGNISHHSAWSNVHIPMDTIPMVRNYEFRNGVMARDKLSLAENGEPVIVWMNDNVKLILSNASTTADEYIKLIGPVECWDKDFSPTADQTQFAECDRANYFRLFDGKTYIMPYKNYEVETNPKAYYYGYILEESSSGGSSGGVDIGIPIYRDLTITNGRQSRELIPSGLGYDKPIVIFSNVRVEKLADHSGNTYTGVYQIAQHNYHDETVANSFAFFVRELDQSETAYIFSSDDTDRNFVKSELTQSAYSKEAIDAQIDAVSTGLPIFKNLTITNGVQSEELFGGMTYKDMQAIFSNVRVETTDGKYNAYNGVVNLEQHSYNGDFDAFYVMDVDQCKYAYLYDHTTEDRLFTDLKEVQGVYKERNIPKQTMLTQAEYDSLTDADKEKGLYIVTGEGGSGGGSTGGSSLDVYSTEETRIGTWIDGKPIYRMVFQKTLGNSNDSPIAVLDNDVESIINLRGFIDSSVLDSIYTIPVTTSVGNTQLYYKKTNKTVYVNTGSSSFKSQPATIILEYTKTTDEPEVSS